MNNNIKEKIRQALYSSTNLNVNTDAGAMQYVTKDNRLAKKICRIEKAIREVVESKQTLFTVIETGRQRKRIHFTKLGRDFKACLNSDFFEIKQHYPLHRINPYVELLISHFEQAKYSVLLLKESSLNINEVAIWVGLANELIEELRRETQTSAFIKAKGDHMRSANKNYKRLVEYIDALFAKHSRLVVLRVDLGYLEEYGWPKGAKGPITPTQFKTHRKQLIKGLNKLFLPGTFVGYACKLEYGLDKSFHIHLLVFLDGSKVREDVILGRIIGDYWNNIVTAGKGMHFNCNAVKAKYGAKCAIGMIKSSNEAALKILKTDIALYLTKTDYYIKLVLGDGGRTFFKGNMPKPRTSNRGRPRALKMGQLNQELGTATS